METIYKEIPLFENHTKIVMNDIMNINKNVISILIG